MTSSCNEEVQMEHNNLQLLQELLNEGKDVSDVVSNLKSYFNHVENHIDDAESDHTEAVRSERNLLRNILFSAVSHLKVKEDHGIDHVKLAEVIVAKFQNEVDGVTARQLLQKIKRCLLKNNFQDVNDYKSIVDEIDLFLEIPVQYHEDKNMDKNMQEFETVNPEQLFCGWDKNKHELKKRHKKMNRFSISSEIRLDEIEKEMRKSQENNKLFRQTLDIASDKISTLIHQLQDANKQSEYLQQQIDIVDDTVAEMEKCKQRTDRDCAQLQEDLNEKQSSLVHLLKRIDKDLETNLLKHQDYLEKNKNFNEALEEIHSCYADFEDQENAILAKYAIVKPDSDHHIDSAVLCNRINMELNEKVEILKSEHRKMSVEKEALIFDVGDLFSMNNTLTAENFYLQSQLDVVDIADYIAKDDEPKKARIVRFKDDNNFDTDLDSNSADDVEERKRKGGEMRNIEEPDTGEDGDVKSEVSETVKDLKSRMDELSRRNEHLATLNFKVQEVYEENKELLEENNCLNDEIEKLEEKVNIYERRMEKKEERLHEDINTIQQVKDENVELKKNIFKLKEAYQPRLIHIKTRNADILKLETDANNNINNTNKEEVLEKALLDEKDLSTTLENSNKQLHDINKTLIGLCRKINLDKVQTGVTYKINIQSENEQHSSNGVFIDEKEKESLKIRNSTLKNVYNVNRWKDEDNIVEELSSMLQESYQQCDDMKVRQRQLKEEVEQMVKEIKALQIDGGIGHVKQVLAVDGEKPLTHEPLAVICQLLIDLGVQKLENGVVYTVHFQAMSKTASTRRASKVYQHSCKEITFDAAKRIIGDIIGNENLEIKKRIASKPPRDDFSSESLNLSLQDILKHDETSTVPLKNTIHSKTKEELERLLRISRREVDDLKIKNKKLQIEMMHVKKSREAFTKEKNDDNEEEKIASEEEDEYSNLESETFKNDGADFEQAYKLSEANCIFLERKYREVEKKLKNVEAIVDQQRDDSFDKGEMIDCLKQELLDVGAKQLKSNKLLGELKKDLEYLERDVEYYKQKLEEHNIDFTTDSGVTKREYGESGINFSTIKADLEMATKEKQSIVLECDSLRAKVRFLQTENNYLEQNLKDLKKEESTFLKNTNTIDISIKERSNSFVENEVKEIGLAKRYKRVEKENKILRREIVEIRTEKGNVEQTLKLQLIEIEAIKSTNENMQTRIIELEKSISELQPKTVTKRRKESVSAKEFAVKFAMIEEQSKGFENSESLYRECEVIKEDAILLAHENEEIKESNEMLLKRNSNLRKESLAAGSAWMQVELLKEKISSLENENEILKFESMRANKHDIERRSEFSRKISQEFNIQPYDPKILRKSSCVVLAKATQTEEVEQDQPRRSLSIDYGDTEIVIEELQFVIEDLTKRNSELKSNLYGLEKKLEVAEKENSNMEDINNRLLNRNEDLKKQIEELVDTDPVLATETLDSADTDDPSLGINLFFKNDILGEYEKAELEEENKALKYENRMLKDNINENEKVITTMKCYETELSEANVALATSNNELISILQELQGDDFTKELISSLNIHYDTSASTKNKEKTYCQTDNDIILTITPPLQVQSETIERLKKQIDELMHQNTEHKATINHLERQLLQVMSPSRDGDKERSFANETVDELLEVKFLLESNPDCFAEDISEKDNDFEDFATCIQEGEFASEMEDFFKNYTTEGDQDTDIESEIEEDRIAETETEPPMLYKAHDEPAKKIGGVSRFRAKEHVEKALDVCQQQLMEYKQRNDKLYSEIDQLEKKYQNCKSEKDVLDKTFITAQQNLTECVATAEDQSREIEKFDQEIKDLKAREKTLIGELSKNEISITELKIHATDLEEKVSLYEDQMEKNRKEIDEEKKVVAEQERLIQQLETCNKSNQSIFNELKTIQSKNEQLTVKNYETQEELDAIIAHSRLSCEEVDEKEKKIKESEEDLRELLTVLKENEEKIEELESANRKLNNDVTEQQENKKKLEEFLLNENKALSSAQKKYDLLEQAVNEKEKLIEVLKHELKQKTIEVNNQELMQAGNVSFEIKNTSSDDSKQATEISLDENDMMLPEVFISKVASPECHRCYRRSQSFPAANSSNLLNYPSNNTLGLSDISDVESMQGECEQYTEDYVFKLKAKLKLSREKIRDKNKIIRNQNLDIDTFLEDIRLKEQEIENLKKEVRLVSEKLDGEEEEEKKLFGEGIFEVDTPSFLEVSLSNQLSETDKGEDIINELLTFAEHCCSEISELRGYVNTLKVQAHPEIKPGLHERMEQANKYINKLKSKIQTCIDLKLISCSESIDYAMCADPTDRDLSTPCMLDSSIALDTPGKTVNEIRADNDKLKQQNNELKQQMRILETKLSKTGNNKENISDEDVAVVHSEVIDELAAQSDDKENTLSLLRADSGCNTESPKEENPLSVKLWKLKEKLKTAETQIEKDWVIIESQGYQLENLHQQYIEQRDENKQNRDNLEKTQKVLKKKEKMIQSLNEAINDIQAKAKHKEEELEKLLEEKEGGIDKLHSMISELEKSLTNSQSHIDGILNESLENRDREMDRHVELKDKEALIENLKVELENVKDELESLKSGMESIPSTVDAIKFTHEEKLISLKEKIESVSFYQKMMNKDIIDVNANFKNQMIADIKYIHDKLTKISSDDYGITKNNNVTEEVPNQGDANRQLTNGDEARDQLTNNKCELIKEDKISNGSGTNNNVDGKNCIGHQQHRACDGGETVIAGDKMPCAEHAELIHDFEEQIKSLSKELYQCKNALQSKETIHRLQIDTIVQSLAKRSNIVPRTNGKILIPTHDLSKASSRMGSKEFLETCLKKMEKDSNKKEKD